MRIALVAVDGPGKGRQISIRPGDVIVVGRTEWSDISFESDQQMSARHFTLDYSAPNLRIIDQRSTNGTQVNGEPVMESPLNGGDQVVAGTTQFVVKAEANAPDPQSGGQPSPIGGSPIGVGGAPTQQEPAYPGQPTPNPGMGGGNSPLGGQPVAPSQSYGGPPTTPEIPVAGAPGGGSPAAGPPGGSPIGGPFMSPPEAPSGSPIGGSPPVSSEPSTAPNPVAPPAGGNPLLPPGEPISPASGAPPASPPPSPPIAGGPVAGSPIANSPIAGGPVNTPFGAPAELDESEPIDAVPIEAEPVEPVAPKKDSPKPPGGPLQSPPPASPGSGSPLAPPGKPEVEAPPKGPVSPIGGEAPPPNTPEKPAAPAASVATPIAGTGPGSPPPSAPPGHYDPPPQGNDEPEVVYDEARKIKPTSPESLQFSVYETRSTILKIHKANYQDQEADFSAAGMLAKLKPHQPMLTIVQFQKAGIELPEELTDVVPLFSWLPDETAISFGPVIIPPTDQIDVYGLFDEAWDQDSIMAVFAPNVDEAVKHLQELVRFNLGGPAEEDGLFGYCWPGVISALLENQEREIVERIYGGKIDSFVCEVPGEEGAWQLFGSDRHTEALKKLGFTEIPLPKEEENDEGEKG